MSLSEEWVPGRQEGDRSKEASYVENILRSKAQCAFFGTILQSGAGT